MKPFLRLISCLFFGLLALPLQAQNLLENKDDWAMAGPGAFVFDEDGIATATGGMGLFWHQQLPPDDFVLTVEFKAPNDQANSGVFVRFPDPGNDPWVAVKQGLEVQVQGDSTGEIFSFQKPDVAALESVRKSTGWNTLQITAQGPLLRVAVNGKQVNRYLSPRRLSGYFGIQNHDPKSAVQYRKITLEPAPPLARHEQVALRKQQKPNARFFEHMDLGPTFMGTFVDPDQDTPVALKGLAVALDPYQRASVMYDTETLNCKAAWHGFVSPSGTPWDGRHSGANGTEGGLAARLWTVRNTEPGWAHRGAFDDPREVAHGPLPRDWARYGGLTKSNGKVVVHYRVGETEIDEHPTAAWPDDQLAITRHFQVGPRPNALQAVLLSPLPDGFELGADALRAGTSAASPASELEIPAGKRTILSDRSVGDWSDLAAGAPGRGTVKATFRWVADAKFGTPHPAAGADGSLLPRLGDQQASQNNDDTTRSAWLDGNRQARVLADLGDDTELARVCVYSWHRSNRSPQRYTLFGAVGDKAPKSTTPNPERAGWTKLGTVDTTALGEGGKHLSVFAGTLGRFRHLLFDLEVKNGSHGPFLTEIDLFGQGDTLPQLLQPARLRTGGAPHFALLDAPAGVTLSIDGDRLLMNLPAGNETIRFGLAATTGDPERLQGLPGAIDFAPLLNGGERQYTETVTLEGRRDESDAAIATDTIPVPIDNPYAGNIRFGAFDFFSDGTSGAASTWNGEVWRFEGVDDELKAVTWTRIATGLFQSLGLKIVDDVIFVQGRDGITKLIDLNGDGEIDRYDCFNNEVHITRNFHEFSFDLQTDKAGNFYFSKGAPVRAGGRGFDHIVKHHGTVMKVSADGSRLETVATGLRAPGGVGVGPNGEISTGENEGTFVPRCKITWTPRGNSAANGTFNGVIPTAQRSENPATYDLPLCWLPYFVDNSSGSQRWVPADSTWGGEHAGEMLHLSYGKCSLHRVLREEVDGVAQAGIYRIPARLNSSAMRARFNPKDHQLYVIGFRGWQTTAAKTCGFHRLRDTGKRPTVPTGLEAKANGMLVRFNRALDPETAKDPGAYAVRKWKYIWGPQYGSGRFSIDQPNEAEEKKAMATESKSYSRLDLMTVKSVSLLEDGKAVFLELDPMTTAMQMEITGAFHDEAGAPVALEIFNTVHRLGSTQAVAADARLAEPSAAERTEPGLLLTLNKTQDARIAPRAALFVAQNSAPSAYSKNHNGFSATLVGKLQLDRRQKLAFRLAHSGEATLKIDGKQVVPGVTASYDSGLHDLDISYRAPATGDAQLKLLWEGTDFVEEPVPASAFRHVPTDFLAAQLHKRTLWQTIQTKYSHAEYAQAIVKKQDCAACHAPGSKTPNLEIAGAKLRVSWMERFFKGEVADKPRSWMPPCGHGELADPRALALGLAALHGNGPLQKEKREPAAATAANGKTLVGATGYACNTCHAVGEQKALQVFEGAGPNLAFSEDRLRPDYYHRWMHNPQRVWPGTIMPKYTSDKKTMIRTDLLGGSSDQQLDAMWEYLRSL